MPTLLLITEQERLRLLFARLGQAGLFRLRSAPTLSQGAEEIAVRLPHYVFVEVRPAGLPGADSLRYLRDLLPEETEVILMIQEAALSDELRKAGGLFSLDLSLDDEALQRCITDILPRSVPQQAPPLPEPLPRPEKTARELLFTGSGGKTTIARDKRVLWFIALALAVISLSVIAFQAGSTQSAARPNAVASAPQAIRSGTGSVPGNPVVVRKTAGPAVGLVPVALVKTNAPPRNDLTYTVRPGDTLLKILRKESGIPYHEALTVVLEVKRLNSLDDHITPGQTLVIPARSKESTKATIPL